MLPHLKSPLRFALRHWGKSLILVVVLSSGAALYAKPDWRQRAETLAQPVLEWVGFVQHSHDSDDVYWCPMHPQIKRKNANDVCPICNMALVLLEGGRTDSTPGELTLTVRQVQQAGVVSEAVLRRKLYRETDTSGRIDYDERHYAGISSWTGGKSRIDKLYVNFTGDEVKQGQVVAEIYSPALITAQEEYLVSLAARRERPSTSSNRRFTVETLGSIGTTLLASARQKLIYQGLTEQQVNKLTESRSVLDRIPIQSPISGTVIERHVQEGQYVDEGDWLLHLADLSQIWVLADIYENEIGSIAEGQTATVSVQSFPGETFEAMVSFIDPLVQPDSRTLRVRFDISNPEGRLKPGMYARVQLRTTLSSVLAVPENAVMWTGQRAVAIVRQSEGTFQPRELRLGDRWLYESRESRNPSREADSGLGKRRRYHAVLAGLSPGEQVVTAGAFLINAEAQFQNVLAKMLPPEDQPCCLSRHSSHFRASSRRAGVIDLFPQTARSSKIVLWPRSPARNAPTTID